MLTLEFEDYYFTTVYTPNAVDGLKRLAERQEWAQRIKTSRINKSG